jgi:hypothetical protein
VQHLGAEVGQFGGFGEGDGLDAMAAGQNGGVGGEHAVDVGPDLNFFGADARADDGRGEIGTAAAERGGDAVFGGAMKPPITTTDFSASGGMVSARRL